MPHGCRFGSGGKGRGGFGHHGGPRFGLGPHPFHQHPFHHHGHAHEHGPFGHHVNDTEETMVEFAKELSRREYDQECKRGHCESRCSKQDKKNSAKSKDHVMGHGCRFKCSRFNHECKRGHCSKQVMKNSIDPVWTIVETKNGKFTVSIVLGEDAKPEDVKLNVKGRDLYIEIKMDKRSEDGTSHLTLVFTKKVALPEEVKVDDIRSNLTPEGILKIEAGVPAPEEVTIPVSMSMETSSPPTPPADN